MKRQSLSNDEIKCIGDKVLKACRLADENIDRILVDPNLFKRIVIATAQRRDDVAVRLSTSPRFSIRTWRIAFALCALLAIVAVCALLLIDLSEKGDLSREVALDLPRQISPAELPELPAPAETRNPTIESRPLAPRARKTAAKARKRARAVGSEDEDLGEFQAVAYNAGINAWDEDGKIFRFEPSKENGQILRVELPRSSLFAMGIDVQVENQKTDNIKADLLIGEDGLMKGVRIVDK